MRRAAAALMLVASAPAAAQSLGEAISQERARLSGSCRAETLAGAVSDVVVCARRQASERYRSPLPFEDVSPLADGPVKGEPQSAAAALVPRVPCGPFAGQRQCSKAEALLYGYGGGRDPLSLAIGLVTRAVDPEAELPRPPKR